jgi:hypothetical protein
VAAAADSWACTKDVKSAMNIAKSISTMKNTAERMTAARNIWQSDWHGEERIVYLDGRSGSAFSASLEQDYYYRRRVV